MSGKEINELIQTGELAKADLPAEAVKEAEVSEELLEAAEAHANKQIADIKEENRKRKRKLIKLGAMTLLSVIIFIFTTIAWFTQNREVSSGSMAITTATMPFEIESNGAAPAEYTRLFGLADNNYSSGTKQGDTNRYRTGSTDQIWWRLDDADDTTSYVNGFRPGASGVLSFNVIPKDTNALTVNCKYSIRTFISTVNEQTNVVESLTEITDDYGTNNQKNAKDLINGHILFFENKTVDASGHEIYSGFIGTDGIDISVPAGGNPKSVTIYWKWMNTFDQIFLKTNDSYYDFPMIADSNSDDRANLTDFIQDNHTKLFSGLDAETIALVEAIDYTAHHSNTGLLSKLNDGYNTADQIIGVNLQYFLIEMIASPATGNSN